MFRRAGGIGTWASGPALKPVPQAPRHVGAVIRASRLGRGREEAGTHKIFFEKAGSWPSNLLTRIVKDLCLFFF